MKTKPGENALGAEDESNYGGDGNDGGNTNTGDVYFIYVGLEKDEKRKRYL